VNATGTIKMKPLIIGTAAKPRCLSSWELERDLLLQLSGSEALDVEDLLSDPSEQWTAKPVESDDEDAEFLAAYRASEGSDEEEADDSETVVSMKLPEARAVGEKLKTFVQQNQGDMRMQKHLHAIEELVRDIEAMTVSARTRQMDMQ
jgi:hypothetical protein